MAKYLSLIFFAQNEVGICSDSYHSTRNLLGSTRIEDFTLPHLFRRNLPDSTGFHRTQILECVGVTWAKLACLVREESTGIWRNLAEYAKFQRSLRIPTRLFR
jgi:hypothetical protein